MHAAFPVVHNAKMPLLTKRDLHRPEDELAAFEYALSYSPSPGAKLMLRGRPNPSTPISPLLEASGCY